MNKPPTDSSFTSSINRYKFIQRFDIDIKNLSKEEGSKLTENSLLYKGGIEIKEDVYEERGIVGTAVL